MQEIQLRLRDIPVIQHHRNIRVLHGVLPRLGAAVQPGNKLASVVENHRLIAGVKLVEQLAKLRLGQRGAYRIAVQFYQQRQLVYHLAGAVPADRPELPYLLGGWIFHRLFNENKLLLASREALFELQQHVVVHRFLVIADERREVHRDNPALAEHSAVFNDAGAVFCHEVLKDTRRCCAEPLHGVFHLLRGSPHLAHLSRL